MGKKMEKYMGTTLPIKAGHQNLDGEKDVAVKYVQQGERIMLRPVYAKIYAPIKAVSVKVITMASVEQRPKEPRAESEWALKRLGFYID